MATLRHALGDVLRGVLNLFRPLVPHVLPVFICAAGIPLILFVSAIASWVVWNNVPAGWHVPLYFQYGDGLVPYADVHIPKLILQQPYDISVHLIVPATPSSYELGNFMTSLKVLSLDNQTLADARRPSLIIPPPRLKLKSLFSGSRSLISVQVPLLLSYLPTHTRTTAHVEIGRNDFWKTIGNGGGRELNVYAAYLHGDIKPRGIIGILSHFPLLVSFSAGFLFFAVALSALAVVVLSKMDTQKRIKVEDDASVVGAPQFSEPDSTSFDFLPSPEPESTRYQAILRRRRLSQNSSSSADSI